ncbi:VWA domain-containing protein [Lacinutrix salivirga]
MQTQTLLYIILAGIIALLLALFQYWYNSKHKSKTKVLFTFLRFLTLFSIFLLLINPKFEQNKIYTEKPNLVVAIDNSSSIPHLEQSENVLAFSDFLKSNTQLSDKFNIDMFSFGNTLNLNDSLSFKEETTNISKTVTQLNQIYKNTVSPTILVTDGNQTLGSDYEFAGKKLNQPIYPIILGDTINYTDLKISRLNVNKYAYLKNQFPVEAVLVYNGNSNVSTKFVVKAGNSTVYSKAVQFSKTNNSQLINFTLPANRVGVQSYKAQLVPISNEKNTVNNYKNFAVEVIDEKTKVAIVSSMVHPDLGVLKKSIESNQQRTASFFKPNEIINKLNDFQLVILYQPNNSFKQLYSALEKENKNKFVITGPQTDWNFLNKEAKFYSQDITSQTEDYQPELDTNYGAFIIEDLDFSSFPPVASSFGETQFKVPFQTLLNKTVDGFSTNEPLLVTLESDSRREAVLFGENIWKWRAQSFINNKSFTNFDNFLGKLIQYLASNKRKNRLDVDYESFYQGNNNVLIKAQFFNKNYEFDATETLAITVTDKVSNIVKQFPLLLKGNNYEVDLSQLPASDYSFTVKASRENISKSGNFKILEYNIEQQFLNANVSKLKQLAINSNAKSYFITNYQSIVNDLVNDDRYKPIQKTDKKIVPLIDWKYLLFFIALTLALEWFLRKYNGLI